MSKGNKKGRGNNKGDNGGARKKDAGVSNNAAAIPPTTSPTTTSRQTRSMEGKKPNQENQDKSEPKSEPKSKKARLNLENGNLKANLDSLQTQNDELQEKINKLQAANEEYSEKITKKNKYIKDLIDKNKSLRISLKESKAILDKERQEVCPTCTARELAASFAAPAAIPVAQQPDWYQPRQNPNWHPSMPMRGYFPRGRGRSRGPYWTQQ